MQPYGAVRFRLSPEATVGIAPRPAGSDVISRGIGVIGVPVSQQLRERLLVARRIAYLGDRTLVPIETQPREGIEDLRDVLLGGSLAVGIFDPKHERARRAIPVLARTVREQPVVERGTGAADVQRSGRRWSESNSHDERRPMLETPVRSALARC